MLLHEQLFSAPPTELKLSDLKAWHAAPTTPLGIKAGEWRDGPITFGSYFGFPPSDIEREVNRTFNLANGELLYLSFFDDREHLEGLVNVSAYVHARLIRIHPFEDGNGRTARLVLTAMFLGAGFDPPDLDGMTRQDYLSALNTYNHRGTDDLNCPALAPLKKLILTLL